MDGENLSLPPPPSITSQTAAMSTTPFPSPESETLPFSIVLTALYVILFTCFLRKSFTTPHFAHYFLVIFCLARISTFSLLTTLSVVASTKGNNHLIDAEKLLLNVGFFALLYPAYILVLDLELSSPRPASKSPIIVLSQHRPIFRLLLVVAVVLGIMALARKDEDRYKSATRALQEASNITFMVLTLIQALQTLNFLKSEISGRSKTVASQINSSKFGLTKIPYIILLISLCLLLRQVFATGTMSDLSKEANGYLWYPLLATPEALATILFTLPGLIPLDIGRHEELPK